MVGLNILGIRLLRHEKNNCFIRKRFTARWRTGSANSLGSLPKADVHNPTVLRLTENSQVWINDEIIQFLGTGFLWDESSSHGKKIGDVHQDADAKVSALRAGTRIHPEVNDKVNENNAKEGDGRGLQQLDQRHVLTISDGNSSEDGI